MLEITCKAHTTLPLANLKWFQGDLAQASKKSKDKLERSLKKHGIFKAFDIWDDGEQLNIVDGHARKMVLEERFNYTDDPVPVNYTLAKSYEDAKEKVLLSRSQSNVTNEDNLLEFMSGMDYEEMSGMLDIPGIDFDKLNSLNGKEETTDVGELIDRAGELNKQWEVKEGDLWQLGNHRLMSGDSTKVQDVEQLMNGAKVELLHADPPYGMGKEKDGVLNDNLYREKLDAFQMQWWQAIRPHLKDNASAYIWGNAEDLWRLWGDELRDSERLTFRNEIVWDKKYGQGMESDQHRMFPTASERCIFFMIGEQGFSINADVYWDGWENVRVYLKNQKDLMGWDNSKCKELAGHSKTSGCHWFDKSQWTMPTGEVYNSWQQAARGDGFKKEYDELKKEFYSTRAYFDNTHESMTDVWSFERVKGEERYGHATPKPVRMIERIIKSSSEENVVEPFIGSGSTLIASEKTNRTCYGMELDPKYCAVTLERWSQYTNQTPVKI